MRRSHIEQLAKLSTMSIAHENDLSDLMEILTKKQFEFKAKLKLMSDGDGLSIEIDYVCKCGASHEDCNCYRDTWLLYGSSIAADYIRRNKQLLRSAGHLPALRWTGDCKCTFEMTFEYSGSRKFAKSECVG